MKKTVALFSILALSSCSMLAPTLSLKKSLARATAQTWAAGAPGGGRGATFRLNFYQLKQPLNCDTLWVNNMPLETETTVVGDTTYVNSFFYTEDTESLTLANAKTYSAKLKVYIKEKPKYLLVESFKIVKGRPNI